MEYKGDGVFDAPPEAFENLVLTPERVRDIGLHHRITSGPGIDREYMPSVNELTNMGDMISHAVAHGQLIDFGHWPNDMIKDTSMRAGKLYTQGALAHPFQTPYVFLHSWNDPSNPSPIVREFESKVGVATVAYLVNPFPNSGNGICIDFEALEFMGFKVESSNGRWDNCLGVGNRILFHSDESIDTGGASVSVSAHMLRFSSIRDQFPDMNWSRSSIDQMAISNVLEPVMVALAILNTRGIKSETITPGAKLNRSRMKSGKPTLAGYRKVDSKGYVTAILARQERSTVSLGGHHASPIPHVRRGHFRHYKTGEKSFIHDTLVNATDDMRKTFVANRSHYTVKEPE